MSAYLLTSKKVEAQEYALSKEMLFWLHLHATLAEEIAAEETVEALFFIILKTF